MHVAIAVILLIRTSGDTLSCEARGSREWLATRPSPLDSATMQIGTGHVRICYSRPRARGRSVFDSVAPYGQLWRTGANEPTTIRLTTSAVVAGVVLPAGRYVMHTVPGPTQWIVLFYTATGTDAVEMFRSLVEFGRGVAPAESVATPVDQFTIRPAPNNENAFFLEWDRVRVRLTVRPMIP